MSDYISLEALRAMSKKDLFKRWQDAKFPFDPATCANCVTQHKFYYCNATHKNFYDQASRLKVAYRPRPQELRTNLAEIYALRMFHRDLYASTPEPPVAAEEPRVLAAK